MDWAGLLLLLLLHNSGASVRRSLLQFRVLVVVVDAVALVSSHLLLLLLSRVFSSGISSLAACLDSVLNKASADSALSKALDSGGRGGVFFFFFVFSLSSRLLLFGVSKRSKASRPFFLSLL